MGKTLKHILHMKAALWVNGFLYYFKRLWLIGKRIPDSAFSNVKIKKVLSVLAVIVRQIIDFFGKAAYLFLMIGLPVVLLTNDRPELKGQTFAYAVNMLFFLSCILGAFGDSQIFTVTRDKVTCIKYLHMNARTYIQSFLLLKYVPFFLFFLPWLMAFAHFLGGTLWQGGILWLMLFAFRMLAETVQLLFFDRTGKVLSRNILYDWGLILIGLAGAYLPVWLGITWPLATWLLHPVSAVLYLLVIVVCVWYIWAGYSGYEKKLHRSIDLNFLLSTVMKTSSGNAAAFKDIEIKEKDARITEGEKQKFQSLHGYAYINALFFARHKRQLKKPVYYRLMVTAAIFAASVVLYITDPGTAIKLSQKLTTILPSFVFVMYFMTVADKASRAMFYNCDKDLLHYAFYRQPKTILRNFQIRLFRISLYDIVIGCAVCLAAIGFCLLCGTNIFTLDMLMFCAAILLLSVLFTTHHLCLYYIFQPYSESLHMKNPFFSVLNVVMYMLCFLCLQIDTGGFVFTMLVLAFTVLYIIGALALVYRRAPKSFRIK